MKLFSSKITRLLLVCGISLVSAKAIAAYVAWPTTTTVTTASTVNFGTNMSGLFYETGNLWAVQNSPSKLYKLVPSGSNFIRDTANGWSSGKTLRYPNGSGAPDAEGVTKAELTSTNMYVATERDRLLNYRVRFLTHTPYKH